MPILFTIYLTAVFLDFCQLLPGDPGAEEEFYDIPAGYREMEASELMGWNQDKSKRGEGEGEGAGGLNTGDSRNNEAAGGNNEVAGEGEDEDLFDAMGALGGGKDGPG